MEPKQLLEILQVASRLKTTPRHCETAPGRSESVADHSWRIALMAMLLTPEFPEADMNKVLRMCLIHDLGEAFTGDIPTFDKTEADVQKEDRLYDAWVDTLPRETKAEFSSLLTEMNALQTQEAKIYKALDKLEAVISHNEGPIGTWLPLEYDLQRTYGWKEAAFAPCLTELRELVLQETEEKIKAESGRKDSSLRSE